MVPMMVLLSIKSYQGDQLPMFQRQTANNVVLVGTI